MRVHTPSTRKQSWNILATLCLGIFFIAFISPATMAGCNKFEKGKHCPDPTPVPAGKSQSHVVGNNISFESEVGVSCQSEADASAARGDYLCSAPYPAVRLSTFQFSGIFSRKFWDVCHSFQSDDLLSVPDDINFGWTDDCTNGSCDVEVRLSFSGEKVLSATQLAADRLEVVLNGTVYSEQANPFFNSDQLIAVESVELGFQKTSKSYQKNGKLRTIGTCTWYTDMSGDQVEVEFWSMDD